MICPVCQTLNDEKALACIECGAVLTPTDDDGEIVIRHGGMGVAGVIAIVGIVVIAIWLVIQFVLVPMWFNNGNVIGEYSLNPQEVEASIVVGFFENTGLDAIVVCPPTMHGTPGATFSCEVNLGTAVRSARVTMTETGSFTWTVMN